MLSALRNCRNNDDSLKKRKEKKRSGGRQSETWGWGWGAKHFRETQHRRPKGTSVRGNTSLRRSLLITQHANPSLFKLAKYSPGATRGSTPAQIYRQRGGVGSSVKACSVRYWHALPPCLSAACQWTPRCCNVPYYRCQHSHARDIPRREDAHVNNYMQHMIYDLEKCFLPSAKGRGEGLLRSPSRRARLLLAKRHSDCNNVGKRGEADSL